MSSCQTDTHFRPLMCDREQFWPTETNPGVDNLSVNYVTNLGGELMPAEAGCIPTRPASVDQAHTRTTNTLR